MATASVVIALAGGVGAAAGAGVGQFVQWWRESVRTKIEERRRAEDRADALERETRERRQDSYIALASALQELLVARRPIGLYAATAMMTTSPQDTEWRDLWKSNHQQSVERLSSIQGTAALYATRPLHQALTILGVMLDTTFPPNHMPAHIVATLYAVKDGQLTVEMRSVQRSSESDFSQTILDVIKSLALVLELAEWCLAQVRYELLPDNAQPSALAFDPAENLRDVTVRRRRARPNGEPKNS